MDLPLIVALVVLAVVVLWLFLVTLLWLNRPPLDRVLPALPLVPQLVQLVRAIRADPATPGPSRLALGVLLVYLRSPLDLLPDLLPGIGTVDDLVVAGVILRRVSRRVGAATVRSHWQGRDEDYAVLGQLLGI